MQENEIEAEPVLAPIQLVSIISWARQKKKTMANGSWQGNDEPPFQVTSFLHDPTGLENMRFAPPAILTFIRQLSQY
jgi:hypothetical protein